MDTQLMCTALRNTAAKVGQVDVLSAADHELLRDAAELLRVLARMVDGVSITKSFGPAGDWGYETEIGKAIATPMRSEGQAINLTLQDLPVMLEQINSLRGALANVLDARNAEAKAYASYQVAMDNFSGGSIPEATRHLEAMTAASRAEAEARLLVATLKEFS